MQSCLICQLFTILDFRLALSFGVLLNMSQNLNIYFLG
jgi:hypothetical protein